MRFPPRLYELRGEGLSIRVIARQLGISRNTVRKDSARLGSPPAGATTSAPVAAGSLHAGYPATPGRGG
ncbi:MAG: helix-turn-helix domain-containing protein [Actinomycetia bacterium]|nr:helix-turn-helix domain-containing protein [Actinomycetes bacterium]